MQKTVIIIVLLLSMGKVQAAKIPSMTVENIKTSQAIQIIEAVAKDLSYSLDKYDKTNKVLITKFIEWNSITVLNHAKLKFEASGDKVVITMIERQYKSTEGWTNSLTNLSKKNIKKYLGGFADKMTAIASNDELTKQAMANSVLIKQFKPIIEQDGIRIKFANAKINQQGADFSMPNIVIELIITNLKDDTIRLLNPMVNKGIASFDEARTEIRFRNYDAFIAPNETGKLFLYLENDKKLLDEVIVDFGLIYRQMKGVSVKIRNYNMVIPYENPNN